MALKTIAGCTTAVSFPTPGLLELATPVKESHRMRSIRKVSSSIVERCVYHDDAYTMMSCVSYYCSY